MRNEYGGKARSTYMMVSSFIGAGVVTALVAGVEYPLPSFVVDVDDMEALLAGCTVSSATSSGSSS